MEFDITINKDFTLNIKLGVYEKQVLTNRFKEHLQQYNKMGRWLDDPAVPTELKEQYLQNFLNLHDSLNFLIKLLRYSGTTDNEIAETLNIPF